MSIAVFLLALGATARISRFVNSDYLFRGVRVWAIKRWGPDHDVSYGLSCPWCASIWIAGGVYTIAWFYGHTAAYWITTSAFTASWLYATIASWVDPSEGVLVANIEDET